MTHLIIKNQILLIALFFPEFILCCSDPPSDTHPKKSKNNLLYQSYMGTPESVKDWVMEGNGQIKFKNNWMHMYSPDEERHHVFWCPITFPENFTAVWELQNIEPDAGLCIVFFAAMGKGGLSIFDSSLQKRDGTFSQYTKGDISNYHISYYANERNNQGRGISHLRKNSGFYLVQKGETGIPVSSRAVHAVRLRKNGSHITLFVDERKIIDWTDNGTSYGQAYTIGKIGLRQMKSTHFRYRNFKVYAILE